MDRPTRRDLLRGCGGVLATGATWGLAGCTGDGGSDDEGRSERIDPPTAFEWAPSGAAFGADETLMVVAVAVDPVLESEVDLPGVVRNLTGFLEIDGIPSPESADRIGAMLEPGPGSNAMAMTVDGSFAPDDLDAGLSSQFGTPEEREGYTLYRDGDVAAAVTDVDFVLASGGDVVARSESILDARAGRVEQLAESDADATALLAPLDSGDVVTGILTPGGGRVGVGLREDPAATGLSVDFGSDATAASLALVYGAPESTSPDVLAADRVPDDLAWIDQGTVSTSGRVVTAGSDDVSGVPPLVLGGDGVSAEPGNPQGEFEFDREGGDLTITHASGDAYTAENTGIGGECGNPGLAVVTDDELLACWSVEVARGDSVTVGVEAGDRVRVVWPSPDGGNEVHAEFEVSD